MRIQTENGMQQAVLGQANGYMASIEPLGDQESNGWMYGLSTMLLAAYGFVLFNKKKKPWDL